MFGRGLVNMSSCLESISFNKTEGTLKILNQRLLPEKAVYEPVDTVQDGWKVIREMKVDHMI